MMMMMNDEDDDVYRVLVPYCATVMNGSIPRGGDSSVCGVVHVTKVGLRCPVTAVEVIELPGLIYVLVGEREEGPM